MWFTPNNTVLDPTSNHLSTKHIEIDCDLVCERVDKEIIATPFMSTGAQLPNRCANRGWSCCVKSWAFLSRLMASIR